MLSWCDFGYVCGLEVIFIFVSRGCEDKRGNEYRVFEYRMDVRWGFRDVGGCYYYFRFVVVFVSS